MTKHEITYVVIIILLSVVTIIAGYRTKRVGTLIPIIER